MKIVHMHTILYNVISEVICFAINARFYTAASHPNGKAAWMMITSAAWAPFVRKILPARKRTAIVDLTIRIDRMDVVDFANVMFCFEIRFWARDTRR